MSKGKACLFGRVIASSLVALNFMGGIKVCCLPKLGMSTRAKVADLDQIFQDKFEFSNVCNDVLYSLYYDLDQDITTYPTNLVRKIATKNEQTGMEMYGLRMAMHKKIVNKGKTVKCLYLDTNIWEMVHKFRFTRSICRDSINLLNILSNTRHHIFMESIMDCKNIIIRNMKRMKIIKDVSVIEDPRFFHKIDREFKFLMKRLERFEDIKNQINMDNSIN